MPTLVSHSCEDGLDCACLGANCPGGSSRPIGVFFAGSSCKGIKIVAEKIRQIFKHHLSIFFSHKEILNVSDPLTVVRAFVEGR